MLREEIDRLISGEAAEGDTLELKGTIPARSPQGDAWLTGGSVQDYGRDRLLEHVVAFANAHGGRLLIGIAESDDSPSRAKAVVPLPRCADLADRLRLQLRDCVDPQLEAVECVGVPTEEDGSGVVAIRVPASRLAPHRLKTTLECYVRRNDRTEKLTMREIQDLAVYRTQSAADLNERFASRRVAFTEMRRSTIRADVRLRVTAVPSRRLAVPRIHDSALKPSFGSHLVEVNGVSRGPHLPIVGWGQRPILRGTRLYSEKGGTIVEAEALEDGLVEYRLFEFPGADPREQVPMLLPDWILAAYLDCLLSADRLRQASGELVEYGVEVELAAYNAPLRIRPWNSDHPYYSSMEIEQSSLVFPRMSFVDRADMGGLAELVFQDVLNAGGVSTKDVRFRLGPYRS